MNTDDTCQQGPNPGLGGDPLDTATGILMPEAQRRVASSLYADEIVSSSTLSQTPSPTWPSWTWISWPVSTVSWRALATTTSSLVMCIASLACLTRLPHLPGHGNWRTSPLTLSSIPPPMDAPPTTDAAIRRILSWRRSFKARASYYLTAVRHEEGWYRRSIIFPLKL